MMWYQESDFKQKYLDEVTELSPLLGYIYYKTSGKEFKPKFLPDCIDHCIQKGQLENACYLAWTISYCDRSEAWYNHHVETAAKDGNLACFLWVLYGCLHDKIYCADITDLENIEKLVKGEDKRAIIRRLQDNDNAFWEMYGKLDDHLDHHRYEDVRLVEDDIDILKKEQKDWFLNKLKDLGHDMVVYRDNFSRRVSNY